MDELLTQPRTRKPWHISIDKMLKTGQSKSLYVHLFSIFVLVCLVAGVLLLASTQGWSTQLERWIAEMGTAGMMLFPFFYAVCNVLLLPAGLLGISAGWAYGLYLGWLLVLSGNVLGAAIAFFLSRHFFRRRIEKKFRNNPRFKAFDHVINKEGAKIVFFSQLNPLFPTSLFNYIYGITSLSFRRTMFWVALGQAPGLFLYAYLGSLGAESLAALQTTNGEISFDAFQQDLIASPVRWGIWVVGLLMTVIMTVWLGRLADRILHQKISDHENGKHSADNIAKPETR